ncbi:MULTISPECIES: MbtH family protein [unclassified Bradyrhizobium]|uniref:MbtH family protein n=1 Tax=unclassified Bradyrhizobium TaxID=2631580 RepID=UPI002916D2D1|nr:MULTISPECIES: MbtH family NRPS accessory protein [unclassified Bradyrhizobium]
MFKREDEADTIYVVVRNEEEQHSIWPFNRPLPSGWTAIGWTGRKAECLAHIREIWTDMRPLSLRGMKERQR